MRRIVSLPEALLRAESAESPGTRVRSHTGGRLQGAVGDRHGTVNFSVFFLSNYESYWSMNDSIGVPSKVWDVDEKIKKLLPVGSGHFPPCDLQRIGGGKRGWARPIIS